MHIIQPTKQIIQIIKKITKKRMQKQRQGKAIYLLIICIFLLVYGVQNQSFTPSNYSVTPNYAKSTSSLYSFSFNAITSFNSNFDIRIYFPSQYTLTAVSGCGFWVNGVQKTSALCSVSTSTNQIIFTQLQITQTISSTRVQFRTSTARFAGSSTLSFNYFNPTTSAAITSLSNFISLSIVNAIMSCSVTSTSAIVGDNVTYSLSYTPLVAIQTNTVLQIQMQPWGPYSQSNFITTNTTNICNGACTLSLPSSNGNVSEIIRFSSLFGSQTTAAGSISLARARNPASTRQITISIVMLAKVTSLSEQPYMNCSTTLSVPTPNTFRLTNFAPSNTAIGATNIITLRLQVTNPISSISYIRIQPSILTLSYQFNNYNQGTQPFQSTTSDGSLLLGNLTQSTTVSPSILTLNNFTLINPPYAGKPVTLTFTSQNLVDSVFYLVDRATVDIVATPSTITEFGLAIANTSINAISRYTLWFRNVNRLVSTSFVIIVFPNTINIGSSTCSLSGIASTCTITNSTSLIVDINTQVPPSTNLSLTINSVINPSTTTPTSSISIYTYYEDSLSIVDQLTSGFIVTATSVPFKSVLLTPASTVVGQVGVYTLNVQLANALPMFGVMRIKVPVGSFAGTIVLQSFSIGGTNIPGCSITTLSPMYIRLQPNCFPTSTPASTALICTLSNITNPTSTKPSQTWQVETLYNDLQMQYLMSGITATMITPAQITSFAIVPTSQIVNAQSIYQFDITFLYPHYTGDRVILTFPDGVLLGAGFQCVAVTTAVVVSCFQTSQVLLEVTLTTASAITQLSFKVTSITNNWFASTRTIAMQTTTNDTTYYYMESGQNTINFIPTALTVSVLSNQQIILLGQSTIKLTITSPFTLSRATDLTLLYLLVNVPTDLVPLATTCSLSYSSANCAMSGQLLNITSFGSFSSPLVVTFKATTNYFVNTSSFTSQLSNGGSLISSDSLAKLTSYCTSPCKQCTSTKTQCLSCLPTPYTVNNTYFPDNSTCVNVCPTTYYATSGMCAACNQTACLGCTGGVNNCTSCQTGKYLFENGCLTLCPTQYYPINGTCVRCVAPCLTCSSATVCLTCTTGYFLDIDSRCVTTCSNISYIGLNSTCQLCTNNCRTCSGTLTNCTSCEASQYLLFNNTCVRACSSGYYNNVNSTCLACVSPCLTCSSRTVCQSCVSNYYLYNGTTCTTSCPNGTLAVVNTCQKCDSKCATCSALLTNCTSCANSLLYYDNQCVTQCPPLFYPYNGLCSQCIPPCVTCSSSPSLCLSCSGNLFLLNNTCLTVCPTNGYYTQGQTCLPCTQNCLTCQSLATCKLCQSGYYLLSGGCVSSCPASNPIISNRECFGCSEECSTCYGTPTNCTTCTVFYFKYLYTCVKNCPITYYSNTMTYQCEDGLSSKIVFFPVLITSFVVIGIVLVIKIFARETSFITSVAALMNPLQLAIWCYVLSQLFAVFKQPDIQYTVPIVLLALAIVSYFGLAVTFFFFNRRKMEQDDYATQWASNNVNYAVSIAVKAASLLLGCRFFRILYSRLFNTIHLSLAYRNRSNVFTIATIFTLCFLIFSEIPALVGCWFLVYNKTLKDQTFYTSIEGLVVTIVAIVFSLLDIYKSDDYFDESQFCKMKKYVQKVKDFSTMNKLEQGFEVSHEEGSVDAQRFVSTSGGKFFYSKQKPEDIKDDFYFEENEGVSQATDVFERDKKSKTSRAKNINIFGPIMEEEGQYYENEKFTEEEINTEAKLQENRRKIKSFGSDDEEQLSDKIERRQQIGPEQNFDDSKSLIGERQRKGKWNNIISKRMQLSQKIFNRHPPNLAQIDQPMMQDQDQNQDSTAKIIRHLDYQDNIKNEQGNSQINMKKRHRKKKKMRSNKELEEIYLQRLTDKKQKSTKDMFLSDKSLKYDF